MPFGGPCRDRAAISEQCRPWRRRDRRAAVIGGLAQLGPGAGTLLMLRLLGSPGEMLVVLDRALGVVRTGPRALAAVIARATAVVVVDHGAVVAVVDIGDIDVVDRAVVIEPPLVPAPAVVTVAAVAIAVVDAAVVADVGAPVAGVEGIEAAIPGPVTGRPQEADLRRLHPGSGHPVVVVIAIGPVARGPDVAVVGQHRLFVDRQLGRRDADRHRDLGQDRQRCQQGQHEGKQG